MIIKAADGGVGLTLCLELTFNPLAGRGFTTAASDTHDLAIHALPPRSTQTPQTCQGISDLQLRDRLRLVPSHHQTTGPGFNRSGDKVMTIAGPTTGRLELWTRIPGKCDKQITGLNLA